MLDPGDFYSDRGVRHSAQGDVHDALPFVHATVTATVAARGARKRPGEQADVVIPEPLLAPGIVCSYTCGFTAQPPGTDGYSHPYRLVAPIWSFQALRGRGVSANELRKLRDGGFIQGLFYMPQSTVLALDDSGDAEWRGNAAALLYRACAINQAVLDARPRLARLSERAQRILIAALIQTLSPNRFDPDDPDLQPPDMTDGWQSLPAQMD